MKKNVWGQNTHHDLYEQNVLFLRKIGQIAIQVVLFGAQAIRPL